MITLRICFISISLLILPSCLKGPDVWTVAHDKRIIYALAFEDLGEIGTLKGRISDLREYEEYPILVPVVDWKNEYIEKNSASDSYSSCMFFSSNTKSKYDLMLSTITTESKIGFFYLTSPEDFCGLLKTSREITTESSNAIDSEFAAYEKDLDTRCNAILDKFESLFESIMPAVLIIENSAIESEEGWFTTCLSGESYAVDYLERL